MRPTFAFYIRLYLFWFFIFLFFRLLFLCALLPFDPEYGPASLFATLYHGYRLDWSAASYLAAIPVLLLVAFAAGGDRAAFLLFRGYHRLILPLVVVLGLANIIVFRNWGTLLNSRALAFVAQPKEMLASLTGLQLAGALAAIALLTWLVWRLYLRLVEPAFKNIAGTTGMRLIAAACLVVLTGIGIRGGVQLIPVNESSATFSNHRVLNQVAINGLWYTVHNLEQTGIHEENPYRWMADEEAELLVDQLLAPGKQDTGVTEVFNRTTKPNVVLILLESYTADVIEPMGGLSGVTPHFGNLCKSGLLFTHIFSSGFRTDQALTSVFSGFPAQPNRSIIRFPDKAARLPSLAGTLKKSGYATSFYYGGELAFANMQSYLTGSGFDKLTGIGAFEKSNRNSKWGVHDGYVLQRQASELNKANQPFFSVLLTLSTHEPFEVPVATPFNGDSESEKFKKAAWYTDQCLGAYFEKVQHEPWYANTVFILVADHGHRLPLNRDYFDPAIRRIPMLIVSPLLRESFRGTVMDQTGSQHDLPATLLASLGLPHETFFWSNNLLNRNRNNFAYLSLDLASSWVTDGGGVVLPLEPSVPGYGTEVKHQRIVKAYLQRLYAQFLAY